MKERQQVYAWCGITEKEGMQQEGQVQSPVFSYTVVHHHLCHEDHCYITPTNIHQPSNKFMWYSKIPTS